MRTATRTPTITPPATAPVDPDDDDDPLDPNCQQYVDIIVSHCTYIIIYNYRTSFIHKPITITKIIQLE